MKRAPKTKKKAKVPHGFIPIVDAVVEMVFARLAEAAAKAKQPGKPRAAQPDGGLAGAVADHLLAGLTREASKASSKASKAKTAKGSRRRRRAPR